MTQISRALAIWQGKGQGPLGVAVSGGADSVAMLLRLAVVLPPEQMRVATVNHGLRIAAVAEAAFVARLCARLGIEHTTLDIEDLANGANLQARARVARYQALADWAEGAGIKCVAVGHTKTDVAETFLLRLARGSGTKGLSAMEFAREDRGITWLRPLMDTTREDLQAELRNQNQTWCEDPSNSDTSFDRVKMRQALPQLAELGLSVDRLADTAARMSSAHEVVQLAVQALFDQAVQLDQGDVLVELAKVQTAPAEVATRLMAELLTWVSSQPYTPRLAALENFVDGSFPANLHGVLGLPHKDGRVILTREPAAVADSAVPGDSVWDNRWRFPVGKPDQTIQPLGTAGLKQCPDWRGAGRDRRVLLASPALWRHDQVISAPLAGFRGPELVLIAAHPLKNL